jgi:hypothetical protein
VRYGWRGILVPGRKINNEQNTNISGCNRNGAVVRIYVAQCGGNGFSVECYSVPVMDCDYRVECMDSVGHPSLERS